MFANMIHIVEILEGSSLGNIHPYSVFATHDKEFAHKWAERFNNIIDNNTNRVTEIYNREEDCFWCSYIIHERPFARVKKIKYRDGKNR